jgi:hypothetical protein
MIRAVSAALVAVAPFVAKAEEQGLADPAASGLSRWAWLWWLAAFLVVAALVFLILMRGGMTGARMRR